MDYFIVGKNLRYTRKAAGLTLQNVQEAIGMSTSTLSQLERARQTIDLPHLVTLANFYKVSVDKLLGKNLKTNR